jgi:hypothetical protein
MKSLVSYIREPGAKAGARLASVMMGLQYMRKIGFSAKAIIMNAPQHLFSTAVQGDLKNFNVVRDYAATFKVSGSERGKALRDAFYMGGIATETSKFPGSRDFMERIVLGATEKGHPILHALLKFAQSGGKVHAWTEGMNNLRSFGLVAMDAKRGRVFQEGVGIVKRQPLTDVEAHIAGFLSGARRGNFGGRITRPQPFRSPGYSLMFQFLRFQWGMAGKLGNEINLARRASARVDVLVKEANKVGGISTPAGRAKWQEAGREFVDNVSAPVRTLAGLGAFAGLLTAAGVKGGNAIANVLGFVPGIDDEALYREGKIRLMADVGLGPAANDIARTAEVLANLAATYSTDPRKNELFPLRAAEVIAHLAPAGEVMARKVARAWLDPRMRDEERMALLLGFQAGRIKTPQDLAREQVKLLRKSARPLAKPLGSR